MIKNNFSDVDFGVGDWEKVANDLSGGEEATYEKMVVLLQDLVDKIKSGNTVCAKQLAIRASLWAFQLSPIMKDTYVVQHEYEGHSYMGIGVGGRCFTDIESDDPLVGQLQDVIHNARLVLFDQVTDDVIDVFARVSKWLLDNEFQLLSDFEKVIRTIPNCCEAPARSFEEVCSERPDLIPEDARYSIKQFEYLELHGCDVYPKGKDEMPSFDTWSRHVRTYLKECYGKVRSRQVKGISSKSVVARRDI